MKFSIIVPLYNKRETIKRAIESALKQTVPPFEMIVVDDGSTDGSDKVVTEIGHPVRLIKQRNAGPAAARNNGAKHCSGDYLIFLDGDEELTSSSLEEHAACLLGQPDVSLSLASFRKVAVDGAMTEISLASRANGSQNRFAYLTCFSTASVVNIVTSGICVSRSLFNSISGFDESLRCWEITDFLMRASLASRVTGLHRIVTATSYDQPQNSQFARTRSIPEYRLRFACTIAENLENIREPARAEMAGLALGFAYSLWQDGYLSESKLICSRVGRFLSATQRQKPIYRISRYPQAVFKSLYVIRKAMRGIAGGKKEAVL